MIRPMKAAAPLLAAALWLGRAPVEARPLVVCDDVQDPATLDPLGMFTEKSHALVQQIFDGLVHLDPEGRIEPALASSWEQRDPKTMRFHLRRGVRFHDGEPFDAQAVRFTIETMLDPARHFPGAGLLGPMGRVVVVDSSTVDIEDLAPDALLLRRLAGFVFMLPPKAYLEPDFGSKPVGTGPYRFVSWSKGERIMLERNPAYWKDISRAPEGLVFRFVPTDKQIEMLLKGELDVVTELPGTATLEVSHNPRTKVVKSPSLYTVCATLNTSRGPLADARVRRALNYALNKEDMVRYDLLGNGRVIASLSMPGEIGHDPGLKPYAYDPDKAKALLKEAGIVPPLKLRTLTKVQGDRTAHILASQLKEAGIELDIYGVTTDAEAIRDMASKDFDVGISGFSDVLGHVFFVPSIMLYSRSPFSIMRNPEFDKRLEAMVAETEPTRHEALAREVDRYIHDEALSLFTYQRLRTYGVSRGVKFVPHVTGRADYYRSEIIDETVKASQP